MLRLFRHGAGKNWCTNGAYYASEPVVKTFVPVAHHAPGSKIKQL